METIWNLWAYGLAGLPLVVLAWVGWRMWRVRQSRRKEALARGEFIALDPRPGRALEDMDQWAWPQDSRFLGADERVGRRSR